MTPVLAPGKYMIPAHAYHADPCPEPSLSRSLAKLMLAGTPYHAWYEHPRLNPIPKEPPEDKFAIGTAAHAVMLHDDRSTIEVLDFPDYKKNDAKAARDAAKLAGKLPILEKNWDRVVTMVQSGRMQLANHADAQEAFDPEKGIGEETLVWTEEVDGITIWCRCKLDWRPYTGDIYFDYKTTGEYANPNSYGRTLTNVGHDFQAAFYGRGIRALGLSRRPKFKFIVQEDFAPHLLCSIELDSEAIELADRRVGTAMRRWAWCMKNNAWPGYIAKTVTIGVPGWAQDQQMAQEVAIGDMARERKVDPDLLALAMRMQAPPRVIEDDGLVF